MGVVKEGLFQNICTNIRVIKGDPPPGEVVVLGLKWAVIKTSGTRPEPESDQHPIISTQSYRKVSISRCNINKDYFLWWINTLGVLVHIYVGFCENKCRPTSSWVPCWQNPDMRSCLPSWWER